MNSRIERAGAALADWIRGTGGSRALAPGPVERQPESWPASLPFRQRPKPRSRSIAWIPRSRSYAPRPETYELFVAQTVLRDVRDHLVAARATEPFGFLLGHVVYCPWTDQPYVVVDTARRETDDVPHGGEIDRFRRAWASASREARRRRGQVIGWYHRHGVLGIRLSEWDLRLQEEFFPDPWHCALVIAPGDGRVVGGFIQRSPRARLFRKGVVAFQELVDLDAKRISGRRPSVVDWDNYQTDEAIELLRVEWPGTEPPPAAVDESQGETEPVEERKVSADVRKEPPNAPRPRREWKKARKPKPSKPRRDPQVIPGPGSRTAAPESDTAAGDAAEPAASATSRGRPEKSASANKPSHERKKRTAAVLGSGDVGEFLDAVWGPPPFLPEGNVETARPSPPPDPPIILDGPLGIADAGPQPWLVSERVAEREPAYGIARLDSPTNVRWPPEAASGAVAEPTPATPALDAPLFDPESPEVEESSSLGWLLELMGESLRPRAAPDTVPAEAGAQEREPAPAEVAATGPAAPEVAARDRATSDVARSTTRPRRPAREAVVGITRVSPEEDPEAEIPVVMPGKDPLDFSVVSRPRLAAAAAILLAAAMIGGWFLTRGEEQPVVTADSPSIEVARPEPPQQQIPSEIERLQTAFEEQVASYQERSADFELGRLDCTGLSAGFARLDSTFRELSTASAGAPRTGPYTDLAVRMQDARRHFQGSGCAG